MNENTIKNIPYLKIAKFIGKYLIWMPIVFIFTIIFLIGKVIYLVAVPSTRE